MKKKLIVLTILLITTSVSHAQLFIEGNLRVGYNTNKGTVGENDESNSSLTFGVAPKVGYWLNDRMAIGVSISYNRNNQTHRYMSDPDQEKQWQKAFSSQFGFSVFSRYQLFSINKLNVLAESSLGITKGITKAKQTSIAVFSSGSYNSMEINVYPVVSYDLTDRVSILTSCDFARFGFSTGASKNKTTGIKSSGSNFGFGAGSNILNSLADVRVGFIYKFKK